LPKQLQPVAVATTATIIKHDTIRDIVGFSSPRHSASLVDDTSSKTAAFNRSPPNSCRRHPHRLFCHRRKGQIAAETMGVVVPPGVTLRARKMASQLA
jgi:hypothetical protein